MGGVFHHPETILGWQRALVRRRWTYPHRPPRRPPLREETVELIVRLAQENRHWGYLRIVGELKKLAVSVSKSSVAKVLRRHGLGPAPRRAGPTRTEFLRVQAKGMVATDFFSVDTGLLRRYYVLFVIDLERRVVHLLGITANPDGPWVTQVAGNFCADPEHTSGRVRFLIRHRDTKFTADFDNVFASIGAETMLTPVRSPKANAFAEGWVGTARQDCLDHLLVVSRRHLERILDDYVAHYNRARPHRGLDLTHRAIPLWPATQAPSTAATSSADSSTSTTAPPDRHRLAHDLA